LLLKLVLVFGRKLEQDDESPLFFNTWSGGQTLQANAPPDGTTDTAIAAAWVDSVKQWIQQTFAFLAKYSPQAATSFIHNSGGAVEYPKISTHSQARDWYRTLIARINNLRRIMEKPDVYF